jgi:hypothetical protein
MSRKILLLSFTIIFFIGYSCSGTANKKSMDPKPDSANISKQDTIKPATDSSWIDQIQFGYSNEKGDLILVDSTTLTIKPSNLIYALDSIGNKVSIVYQNYQPAGQKNTGRDIYFNFENAGGYLYNANGILDEKQTAVLLTEDFFKSRSLVKLTRTDVKGLPENVKQKIETNKTRRIKNAREIASLENEGSIYLMEFARKKDSALASLVLVYDDNYTYYDFPALYDKQSTWRVDDGGEFWLDGIEILAVFKQGNAIELIFDWIGAEGYNTQYLQQTGVIFEEIKSHYRYTSPL